MWYLRLKTTSLPKHYEKALGVVRILMLGSSAPRYLVAGGQQNEFSLPILLGFKEVPIWKTEQEKCLLMPSDVAFLLPSIRLSFAS